MSGACAWVEMPRETVARGVFQAPWDALDDAALLEHFRRRKDVAYFPVADPDETSAQKIEAIMAGRFEFNGECFHLPAPIAWTANPSQDVEWHILLHKFYYAVGLGMAHAASGKQRYADKWAELAAGWMERTPLGFIAADVTGRRVQNWIYAYYHFVTHGHGARIDPGFHRAYVESIAAQVDYLCENLTPARNHRTLELTAIFLAGVVFPEMARSAHWREFGLAELARNMQTDLLADGVQCELSTDYHHLVLKNYLNVRRLASANFLPVPPQMDECLQRALEFSMHAHKPDGIVPSISDGDARSYLDLLLQGADLFHREDMRYVATGGARGTPPAARSTVFPDSGYVILRSSWGETHESYADAHYMILDCGPLGAGNHGHFDCLSFELAAFGRSLIVDPGRYTYSEAGETNWRVRFRGTASHNTVSVDGRDQTRYVPKMVKGASRHAPGSVRHKVAGPAPEASIAAFASGPGLDYVHGIARSHEYDAVHERRVLHVRGEYWIVCDWLYGDTAHDFDLRFQLAEHAQGHVVVGGDAETTSIHSPGLLLAQAAIPDAAAVVDRGHVSYRYGEKLAAPVLRFHRHGRTAGFITVLYPFRAVAPRLRIEAIALDGDRASPRDRADRFAVHVQGPACDHVDEVLFAAPENPAEWDLAGERCRGGCMVVRRDQQDPVSGRHQGKRILGRVVE